MKSLLSKATPVVYIISFLTNLLVFYFIYSQFEGVRTLNQFWHQSTSQNLKSATQLAMIERNLGYVGFIHHFKNYVIRGSDEYFERAQASYNQTIDAIQTLKTQTTNASDRQALEAIETTLLEYHKKLIIAKKQSQQLPVNKLDQLVRVNDHNAELALNELRLNILPKLLEQQQQTDQKVSQLTQKTITISLFLIPFFLFSNFLTIRLIRQLTITSRELSTILDSTPDAIMYVDTDGKILKANKVTETIFGYSSDELSAMFVEELIPQPTRQQHIALRQHFVQIEQTKEMGERNRQIQGLRKDGSLVDLSIAIASTLVENQMRSVCIIKDITEHRILKIAADTDHLTSLSNRRAFDKVLQKELSRLLRDNTTLSLLLIDIDHFKPINDNLGHASGDLALQEVSKYLQRHTRTYDHLARWGGDEFVMLCPGLSAKDVLTYAERLRSGFESLVLPFEQPLTLSIGIASTSTDNLLSAQELLKNADKAVYAAKDNGRNQVKHFDLLAPKLSTE